MGSVHSTRRAFCVAAIGSGAAALASPVLSQTVTEKFSMGSAMPASHPASTFVADAAASIRMQTGGSLEINFYSDSALGSEPNMYSQLRSGAIDFAVLSCSFLQSVVPVAGIPGVAFAFPDYATLWNAMNGDLGEQIKSALAKVGLTAFQVVDNGFRHTTTAAKAINSVDDLAGLKVRVPPSPLLTSLYATLGAGPTTIPLGELYTALQTRVVDGMENSLVNLEALRVFEVQKFCAKTGHSWDGLWLLARTAGWKEISADKRMVIQSNFESHAVSQQKEFMRKDLEMEAVLQSKGMTFTTPDRSRFRAKLQSAGYYRDWKAKFGADAWSVLERYAGPLS